MSKDMLGSVVRAAVGVPQDRLDVLAKIASTLAADNPAGAIWHSRLKGLLDEEIILPPKETPATKPTSFFSVIATTNLGAVTSKKTNRCFTNSRWAYRDGDFDNWLEKSQTGAEACSVTTCGILKDWTFIEAGHALPGAPQTNNTVELGNWLIQSGYALKPQQVEDLVEATEREEDTGLRTDGYGNFFFVETGNPKSPVSVGDVRRVGRGWRADVYSLGNGDRWDAGSRLLLRNLDASKL